MSEEYRCLLGAQGIRVEMDGRTLFAGVDLDLHAGETTAITGPSGTGKSTLLSCLGFLRPPDEGRIIVAGYDDCTALSPRRRRILFRDVLGFVFQDFGLVEEWTVAKNIDAALVPKKIKRPRRAALVRDALDRVGLSGRGGDRVVRLSGGERQRVAIARLLVKEPRVILADEPTGSLDPENRREVLAALDGCAARGAAVLVVTHDPVVARWATNRYQLADGALTPA